MSMTINSVGYMNGITPSEQFSAAQKQEKAPTEAEKIQQKADSSRPDRITSKENGTAISQVDHQQKAEPGTGQKQPTSFRMDTVEISEEGKAASARLQAQQTETAPVEETTYEIEDLSEYTDNELKQMYYRGEITRQEYEDETDEVLE